MTAQVKRLHKYLIVIIIASLLIGAAVFGLVVRQRCVPRARSTLRQT